jgi:hypothetical protein
MYLAIFRIIRHIFSCNKSITDRPKVVNWQGQKFQIDYKKYSDMKESGKAPRDIYLAAKAEGIDSFLCIGILYKIFGLSPTEAKEVMICAHTGAKSLSEYQGKHILPALKEAFEQEEKDLAKNKDTQTKK